MFLNDSRRDALRAGGGGADARGNAPRRRADLARPTRDLRTYRDAMTPLNRHLLLTPGPDQVIRDTLHKDAARALDVEDDSACTEYVSTSRRPVVGVGVAAQRLGGLTTTTGHVA